MEKPIISFSHATFSYGETVALEDITLQVSPGEILGIIGPNGSGKTTMLRAILGLILPISGSLQIFDCACEDLRCHHRARIGYLPQKKAIDPHFPITVLEAVIMGRYSSLGLFRRPTREDRTIALSALEDVGMETHRTRPLGYLSGVQQQRVLIARALAQKPQVLLLDELTTGIDTPTQHTLLELVARLQALFHLTVLLVSHDINMISPYVHRLALLNKRLYAVGPPRSVLTQDTLSQIYGKEVIVTGKAIGPYVIVADHHR